MVEQIGYKMAVTGLDRGCGVGTSYTGSLRLVMELDGYEEKERKRGREQKRERERCLLLVFFYVDAYGLWTELLD